MKIGFNTVFMLVVSLALVLPLVSATQTVGRPNFKVFDGSSLNWAGYAQISGTYSSVSGTWTVPTLQTTSSGYSSAWVGVGGYSGSTVIQTGTEQDCASGGATAGEIKYHGFNLEANANNGKNGGGGSSSSCKPVYYAWWELYPENAEQTISNFSVNPGDVITASVSKNSDSSWTLKLTDANSGKTFTTTQTPTFTPDQASAEAIVERPALCTAFSCKLTTLANFGTLTFSVSSLTSSPTSITMVDNSGKIMAQPGSISSTGAFSVAWIRNN